MENSIIKSDWLFSHHSILKAKFPPITALVNRPTYHKVPKAPHHPVPKSHGHPKLMNNLTLNEPAINSKIICIVAVLHASQMY